jgi:hypothetical protein
MVETRAARMETNAVATEAAVVETAEATRTTAAATVEPPDSLLLLNSLSSRHLLSRCSRVSFPFLSSTSKT